MEVLDALCNATALTVPEIESCLDSHPRARNRELLRTVLQSVDPGAESFPETRTRLLLTRAGLPRPETQIRIHHRGRVIARIDMGWRAWQVGVEYDGIPQAIITEVQRVLAKRGYRG